MGDREDGGRPNTRYGGNRRRSGAYDLRYSGGAPRYYEPVNRREYWDEQTRPSWDPGVCDAVLGGTPHKTQHGRTVYQCQKCAQFFPKKADAEAAGENHWITIEHRTPWAEHIWNTADAVQVDETVRVPIAAAKMAYNDLSNLRAFCNSCNASAGGFIP
jgi:hypothetical protein